MLEIHSVKVSDDRHPDGTKPTESCPNVMRKPKAESFFSSYFLEIGLNREIPLNKARMELVEDGGTKTISMKPGTLSRVSFKLYKAEFIISHAPPNGAYRVRIDRAETRCAGYKGVTDNQLCVCILDPDDPDGSGDPGGSALPTSQILPPRNWTKRKASSAFCRYIYATRQSRKIATGKPACKVMG